MVVVHDRRFCEERSGYARFGKVKKRTKKVKDGAAGGEKTETDTVAAPVGVDTAYAKFFCSIGNNNLFFSRISCIIQSNIEEIIPTSQNFK